ncbi:hypothetical protein PFISCL1PPCAC_8109, partial [Pristionchus fissidentatus]
TEVFIQSLGKTCPKLKPVKAPTIRTMRKLVTRRMIPAIMPPQNSVPEDLMRKRLDSNRSVVYLYLAVFFFLLFFFFFFFICPIIFPMEDLSPPALVASRSVNDTGSLSSVGPPSFDWVPVIPPSWVWVPVGLVSPVTGVGASGTEGEVAGGNGDASDDAMSTTRDFHP